MKIAIGYAEIAGVLKDYTVAFEQLGYKVTSVNTQPNRFYRFKYHLNIGSPLGFIYDKSKIKNKTVLKAFHIIEWGVKKIIGFFVFFYLLRKHDLFLYQWTSLFNQKIEFQILKFFDKKIISVFLGSDVRHISAFQQEFKGDQTTWELIFKNDKLNRKIKYLRVAELYSDLVLSVPDQAGLAIRPYNHLQLILDTEKVVPNFPENEIPYIIHAPSAKGIKGTDQILSTLSKLESEGIRFYFKLLQNLPNEQVIEELKKADIVIDEIHLNGPGKLGLEAMAYGCALATRHLAGASDKFAPPLCNINPDNLYAQLKALITDKSYYLQLAKEGRKYVEANNSPKKVAADILASVFDTNGNLGNDYIPSFFLKEYVLPEKEKVSKSNLKLTHKVLKNWGVPRGIDLKMAARKGLVPANIQDQVRNI